MERGMARDLAYGGVVAVNLCLPNFHLYLDFGNTSIQHPVSLCGVSRNKYKPLKIIFMLLGTKLDVKEVNLPKEDEQRVMDFLQGAVYCWCKVNGTKPFSARDLVGGENSDCWENTPISLLKKFDDKQAEINVGWLLKKVLAEDKRVFNTQDGYAREYSWDRKE